MNLNQLAKTILEIHEQLHKKATSAVNVALTARNWLIGFYIVEYEQNGADKAKYGVKLIKTLSEKLKQKNVPGASFTNLNLFRQFYLSYPQIIQAIPEQLYSLIIQPVTEQSKNKNIQPSAEYFKKIAKKTQINSIIVPPEKIFTRLSFTHLTELIKIENPLKRAFYEIECINGVWSKRELKRQIASLYYERSGLSKDKESLSKLANKKAEIMLATDIIKNPLTFEFLGLPINTIVEENQLESALIENLQAFLLELGNGFCFEARQKRIIIDDEYFYIDLVFYHRILKCHVIVEIKNEAFNHENIGQLNVYLQYYKHEVMSKNDNPPIGILLCTKSKPTMVKYATVSNKNLFVNEYKLNLPTEKELQAFIEHKIKLGNA